MPHVRGEIQLNIGTTYYSNLEYKLVEFIRNRFEGYSGVPLRIYIENIELKSTDDYFRMNELSFVFAVNIPFTAIIPDYLFSSGDNDYDMRSVLSREFKKIFPDYFNGIYHLKMDYNYDYFSDSKYFEEYGCYSDNYSRDDYSYDNYSRDYDDDCYTPNTQNFAPTHKEALAVSPVIEKTSNIRKVFILRDEGD